MARGWQCEGCGRNYAPHVDECVKCNANPVRPPSRQAPEQVPYVSSTKSSGSGTRGGDLHKMLYEESINEFDDGSWKDKDE